MGGSLGGIFSNEGQGDDFNSATGQYGPSTMQKLVQGMAKGAGQDVGKAMQQPAGQGGGGAGIPGAPPASPVDAGYFAPSALPQRQAMPPGSPSPFYGQ
jgi:hypothetical protein